MKLIKNILFIIAPLIALYAFGVGAFLAVFALTALARGSKPSNVLTACVTTCELSDISSSTDCNVRGGIREIYWARVGDLNLTAMNAVANFDAATQTILGYVMNNTAVFKKLSFNKKSSFYDFTYSSDEDVYTQLVTIILEGKSVDTRNALCKAIACCDLVLHIIDNNCNARVVGIEWDGSTLSAQTDPAKIGRHLDSSGQLGDSKARDEVDFIGESFCPPLFATVEVSAIPV